MALWEERARIARWLSRPADEAAALEHINVTVTDTEKTADLLCRLFDWQIRWQGPSKLGGRTVHVGADDNYLAVYTYDATAASDAESYATQGGLNHIGVLVEDLDATEQRVLSAGFKPFNHADYEPGRRFYFHDPDGIEFEVISYS